MNNIRRCVQRTVCCIVAAGVAVSVSMTQVGAEPAADALAKLDELSQQALQAREALTAAQADFDAKTAEQTATEERHRADLAALEAANAELGPRQSAANRMAMVSYMRGGTGQLSAVLSAKSPQQLIDDLSLQRVIAQQTAHQIEDLRSARTRAAAAAAASEQSAADARAAAEQADRVRAELQDKVKELLTQISAAEGQYAALTPQQRDIVNNAAALVAPAPQFALAPDIAEALPVGVAPEAGLQPNTVLAARAVSAQFPQIAHIGGVRPDSLPWHPSGLAIDIMIPNHDTAEGIALGDAILAYALANAGRFGLQDVIWRGTYYTPGGPAGSGYGHYDHVHITTTPRR